jgi:hypothetical protein
LYLFVSFVPDKYSPVPVCNIATLSETPSPSKLMVARYVRTNCESKRRGTDEIEVVVFLGNSNTSDALGQLVFSAPAQVRDSSGRDQPIELEIAWKSEDRVEVIYPDLVTPTLPGYDFRGERLTVTVTSVSRKMTSNPGVHTDAQDRGAPVTPTR